MVRLVVPRVLLTVAFAVFALPLATPTAVHAQYFGQNKVQYRTFDFKVLKTKHFDVYYYEEEAAAATEVARLAERWYDRLSDALDHELHGRQVVLLYASHPHFQQTNAISGDIGEGTGGVTEAFKRRIVLPLAGPLAETDHVLGHELVHAFQYDMTGSSGAGIGITGPALARLPLWFIEGMAEYLSVGPVDEHTAMWIRDAARRNRLPTVRKLEDPRYFPYRFGQAFWAFLAGRYGERVVPQMLETAAQSGDVEAAMQTVLGVSADSLSRVWHASVREWTRPIAARTDSLPQGKRVSRAGEGRLYLGPALSPDGQRMAFLSEKDLFSIEMFVADARTGEVQRKVTKTAVDPHIQSLQFIQSAGAWSPDGARLAIAAVAQGEPVIQILRVSDGHRLRELRLPGLGEAFHPSWNPEGTEVVFSGLSGGYADLFVIDVESGRMSQLTRDPYADLEPAWSPDGRTVAFVTDRFGTDLGELRFGPYRLALLEVDGGRITPGPGFSRGKNINPQWSPDGGALYFIGDPDGIANVYRASRDAALDDPETRAVTNVYSGASGITRLSPALSVARRTGEILYSVFERGGYQLYSYAPPSPTALRSPAPAADAARLPSGEAVNAEATPPWLTRADSLYQLRRERRLTRSAGGDSLPSALTFQRQDYSPKLSLDYIAQPYLAFGTGSSGLYAGAGAALYWSDMLGDHNLGTALQIAGQGGPLWNNIGAAVTYENRRTRWNWGIGGGQIPYVTRELAVDGGTYEGEPATRERELRRWEVHRIIEGTLRYPFNRVHRVEFNAGFRNIDFDSELRTRIFSDVTGNLLFEGTTEGPDDSLSSLSLGTVGAALVYDNALFGGTGPLLGQRYRIEGAPTFGNITYVSALGDVRRYQPILFPLVLAGRVVHFGRYGNDAEDTRLSELFLGYPWLIRGYDDGSFDDLGETDLYNQLFGSKLAFANLELRLPLLGAFGLVPSAGVPPIEAHGFYDMGVAWTDDDEARFLGGPRRFLRSYGVGLRVNLLGIAIGEIDYVKPLDRPLKGAHWVFTLSPGF